MPRFFFDVENRTLREDLVGIELADREMARVHAIDLANAYLSKSAEEDRECTIRIDIRDEAGEVSNYLYSVA